MPWPHKNKPRTGRRKIGSTKRANRRKNRKQAKKQCTNHKKYGIINYELPRRRKYVKKF